MNVERWNPARGGPLTEAALRRKLERPGYEVATYRYPLGTSFPPPEHDVVSIDAVRRTR